MEFKIKIGDKCKIPKTKSVGESMEESYTIQKAKKLNQDFLFYVGKSRHSQNHMLAKDFDPKYLSGDFFAEHEIELYEEEFPKNWCLKLETKEINEAVNSIDLWESGQLVWRNQSTFRDRWIGFDGKYLQKNMTNNYTEITFDQFKKHILKESTTMKNLLETKFVIENCTLSQRLAIKAYCDEKKIEYVDLEVPSYKTLTFSHGKFRGFVNSVVQRDVVTFSELIQFLDKYQPEPEFKVGDVVEILNSGFSIQGEISTGDIKEIKEFGTKDFENNTSPYNFYIRFTDHSYGGDSKKEVLRCLKKLTLEEIKKWKEENEIKLPKIAGYDGMVTSDSVYLKWGCTSISIATIKELLKLDLTGITIANNPLGNIQIQQIKKFIEHNKL